MHSGERFSRRCTARGNILSVPLFHPFLVVLFASAAFAQPAPSATKAPNYQERYSVLSERNIFVKDRARLAPPRASSSTRPAIPRAPELDYVLTGVVLEDGEFRAYVESSRGGGILKLRIGDPIARGQITQIQIDAIEYTSPAGRAWVDIGHDLSGAIAAIPPVPSGVVVAPSSAGSSSGSASVSASTGTPSAATLPSDPNNPNLSIAERMRLRRLQETKQP